MPRCRPSAKSRPRFPSRKDQPCPCRFQLPPSSPVRSLRGTCSSNRAGCSCQTRAPRADRETSLVTQPPGSIKRRLMRTLQGTKRFANQRESVFSGDRLVLVGLGVVEQRLGGPSDCVEIVVAPRRQLAHGMGGEKIAIGFRWLK